MIKRFIEKTIEEPAGVIVIALTLGVVFILGLIFITTMLSDLFDMTTEISIAYIQSKSAVCSNHDTKPKFEITTDYTGYAEETVTEDLRIAYIGNKIISIGDEKMVESIRWVDVENTTRVYSFNNDFEKGRHCLIDYSGWIEVVAIDNSEKLRVKYTTPESKAGTSCPSGIEFYMSPQEYAE